MDVLTETGRPAAILAELEKKVLWLSAWMIHNANHVRPSRDGLKVGGHQASCASCVSIMTALFLEVLKPADRVAVKPHAGPVFHAINLLLGRQDAARLAGAVAAFRADLDALPPETRAKLVPPKRERRAGSPA